MSVRSTPRKLLVALLLLFAASSGSSGQAPPAGSTAAVTMLAKDGRRTIPLTQIANQEYVAIDDLVPLFQLTAREDTLGALTVSAKGRTIVLTENQALVSVAGRLVSLPWPTVRMGRRWFVPVEFLVRALALISDTPMDLRKASHLLVVGDLRVPRVSVRYDAATPGGRLTIDATPRTASTVSQDTDRLLVKFDADALDIASPPLPPVPPPSLVQQVRLLDATTLAIDVARLGSFRATSQSVDTTARLTIDLFSAQPDVAATPGGAPPPPPAPNPDLSSLVNPLPAIRTIALDPGHGGADAGVKAATGLNEKDLALTVARRIKAAIESRLGIRVLLTRDDDRDVPLDERAAVANNNKADLFISLHANASLRPSTSGATIYYAAFDPGAAASPAHAERVPTFAGGARDLELVEWDQAQTHHVDRSIAFADLLQTTFRDRVPLSAHAVERAPLSVLESANMPAVLIEMGFLTNADDAAKLTSGEFQNVLVQAVTDAIIKFRDSLEAAPR